MDTAEGSVERKMSKSDPSSGIPVPAERPAIAERLQNAFCPAKVADGNPVVEIVRWIVFPWEGHLHVDRAAKYGGPLEFTSEPEFVTSWIGGNLHPQDLKVAVTDALDRLLEPARRYFAAHPELSPATFANPPGPTGSS